MKCLSAIVVLVATLQSFVASDRSPQGVFELNLKQFRNPSGKDISGNCCEGFENRENQCSVNQCATRFRVCLKHYQNAITDGDCTFGEHITPVVGLSSMEIDIAPIEFDIDFKWPGTFSLIIEAWHENSRGEMRSGTNQTLIAREKISSLGLDASQEWTQGVYSNQDSQLTYSYRVKCSTHYYGKSCDLLCKPRNDNFGHYICGKDGERICLEGWEKDKDRAYCTKPKCSAGCHESNGYCDHPNQCKCHEGWQGPNCDECKKYPGCVHGSCSGPFQCECMDGWGGLLCNKDLNYCTNNRPCQNGATCFNTGEKLYTCSCPIGFVGEHCENRVTNKCQDSPCLNGGVCKGTEEYPGFEEYTCECPNGFNGHHCEFNEEFDQCSGSPCENGATCLSTENSYMCTCPTGFEGRNCEINTNDCNSNTCQNGGTCFDFISDYTCVCPYGFVGKHCEDNYNDCKNEPCANGGTCIDGVNDFTCLCKPGFTGKDCSVDINECESSPCLNEGFCVNGNNTFTCKCLPRYSGNLCEIRPDNTIDPRFYAQTRIAPNGANKVEASNGAMIVAVSLLVPIAVIIAVIVICCLKKKQKLEQRTADFEAHLENERNAVSSANKTKSLDDHMIVNDLDLDYSNQKCINTNQNIADENMFAFKEASYAQMSRTKQLNTDKSVNRSSMFCEKIDSDCDSNRTNSTDMCRTEKTKSCNFDISYDSTSSSTISKKSSINARCHIYNQEPSSSRPASSSSSPFKQPPSSPYKPSSSSRESDCSVQKNMFKVKCLTDDLLATEV